MGKRIDQVKSSPIALWISNDSMLKCCDLRGPDLRGLDAAGLDFAAPLPLMRSQSQGRRHSGPTPLLEPRLQHKDSGLFYLPLLREPLPDPLCTALG